MKITGRPQNQWGWARLISAIILAGIFIWTLLAIILKAFHVSWQVVQGYTIINGVELAIIPLLLTLFAGWMEEQDVKAANEKASHQETEHLLTMRRKAVLKHFFEATNAILAEDHDLEHNREKLQDAVQLTLPELDGKGKGEVLIFLHEKGLLGGDRSIDLHNADFREVELHRAHLNGALLERTDLSRARLDGAHLADGKLHGANLAKAWLRHSNLQRAVLTGCNLRSAHLEGANLEGADLSHACLVDAFFKKANLHLCTGLSISDPYYDESAASHDQSIGTADLDQAILIDAILPDGRKFTNEKGRAFLHRKEIEELIDRL